MLRLFTKNSTGVAPDGRWYAGDVNALQDAVAGLRDLTQLIQTGTIAIGESGLQFLRFAAGELRLTGALRVDGILRGLSGVVAGTYTTTQRDAIPAGSRPYGLVILNITNNRLEMNYGTDASPVWNSVQGTSVYMGADVLSNQPSAGSVLVGSRFWATDQAVEYYNTGAAWARLGLPAGATVDWHSAAAAPTGWVAYDGGSLPSSSGIYAALAAHLGGTTKPDTRGRITVGQGTHSEVSAIGANDGLAVATRTPRHNTTAPSFSGDALPSHAHPVRIAYSEIQGVGNADWKLVPQQNDPGGSTSNHGVWTVNSDDAVTRPAVSGTVGTPGPGGTRPTDSAAYLVALKIAKL